uniref:RING-type E3 ubiquitin transferase n=1 Tax=Caenorhabditis tropicalis TaxID=1561998 RepID=A0A1I7TKU8_9PELO
MPQYYCHRCLRSFDLDASAEVACTRCHGEFVEQVNRPAMQAAGFQAGFQTLNQLAEMIRNGLAPENRAQQQQAQQEQPQQAGQEADAPRAAAGGGGGAADITLENFINNMFRPEQREDIPNVTISIQMPGGIGVQIQRGNNEGPLIPQFVGNDGDQRADFDNMMQDILAQFQGEGGAIQRGFTEADIREYLPMKKVTQEHIDNGSQCTTCFDTFKLGEEVGALDCSHIFHRPCIEPWLVTKNSCPVCRQKVNMSDWKKRQQRKAQEAVLDDLD